MDGVHLRGRLNLWAAGSGATSTTGQDCGAGSSVSDKPCHIGVGLALPAFPQPLLQWYGARLAVRSARSLVEEAKAFQPDVVLILKGESL